MKVVVAIFSRPYTQSVFFFGDNVTAVAAPQASIKSKSQVKGTVSLILRRLEHPKVVCCQQTHANPANAQLGHRLVFSFSEYALLTKVFFVCLSTCPVILPSSTPQRPRVIHSIGDWLGCLLFWIARMSPPPSALRSLRSP